MRRLPMIVTVGILCYSHIVFTQDGEDGRSNSLEQYFMFENPHPLSCVLTLFPPLLIQHGMELKSFIRSKTFSLIRKQYGDRRAVDAIFVRAMQMTNNNTAVSLFLSAIATFDHDIVGIKVPLIQMSVPLTSESREDFEERVDNLPAHIYDDSPESKRGDRDKLQHFFGSAFVTFFFESPQTAERVGEFVEQGEDAFIIGGVLDDRDYRANKQGQEFGKTLLVDNLQLPSQFLISPVGAQQLSVNYISFCSGVW